MLSNITSIEQHSDDTMKFEEGDVHISYLVCKYTLQIYRINHLHTQLTRLLVSVIAIGSYV